MPVDLADLNNMAEWAKQYIMKNPTPDFFVGSPDNHQLQRWFVIPRNPVCGVYLHQFLRSDEDRALHDHPYDNMSWLLVGEYREHTGDGTSRLYRAGDRLERAAEEPHRIELVSGPCISLFVVGPRRRDWGFHCPQGWVPWQQFVAEQRWDGKTGELIYGNAKGRGCA